MENKKLIASANSFKKNTKTVHLPIRKNDNSTLTREQILEIGERECLKEHGNFHLSDIEIAIQIARIMQYAYNANTDKWYVTIEDIETLFKTAQDNCRDKRLIEAGTYKISRERICKVLYNMSGYISFYTCPIKNIVGFHLNDNIFNLKRTKKIRLQSQ